MNFSITGIIVAVLAADDQPPAGTAGSVLIVESCGREFRVAVPLDVIDPAVLVNGRAIRVIGDLQPAAHGLVLVASSVVLSAPH